MQHAKAFTPAARRSSVVVQAHLQPTSAQSNAGRRAMLAAGISMLVSAPYQLAKADVCSVAGSVEEETECLKRALAASPPDSKTYSKIAEKSFSAATGVPVSNLDSEYQRATRALGQKMRDYADGDINDFKVRVPLIKALKIEGNDWVSKYARGGSARSDSARRMYIAVDSLIGHLAANGYAPMPSPKIKAMLKSIEESETFLAVGK